MPKFGTKIALFAYFWARILKKDCQIWNQHSQICLFAKSHEIPKMSKFWGKNADLYIFGLEIERKHPRICLNAKNTVIFEISTLEFA